MFGELLVYFTYFLDTSYYDYSIPLNGFNFYCRVKVYSTYRLSSGLLYQIGWSFVTKLFIVGYTLNYVFEYQQIEINMS